MVSVAVLIMRAAVGWLVLVAAGCFAPHSTRCEQVTCPATKVCSPAGDRCVLAEQIAACASLAEGDSCSITGSTETRCVDRVCTPVGCGNDVLEIGEACDDGNPISGDGCSADCRSNETCGNALLDPAAGEACDCGDGSQPLPPGCVQPNSDAAGATCSLACTLHGCGDGIIAAPEQCEGSDLNNLTCGDYGYYGGTLACTPLCLFDLSACSERCGDGTKNGSEACDGTDFGGADCRTYGYYDATSLKCNGGCGVDLSDCTGYCGDGVKNGAELCEGAPPESLQCIDFGFDVGRIACSQLCAPDFAGCGHLGWVNMMSTSGSLNAIWASSERNIYAVGDDGLVVHFDGDAWSTISLGTSNHLHAVGGTGATDLYIGGDSSFARHWNGSGWSPVTMFPAIASRITSVFALSPTNVYAVNTAGDISHLSGGNWTVDYDGSATLVSVWARNATDVWAVGFQTSPLRSADGSTWSPVPNGGTSFWSVTGVDSGDVYLAAFSSIYRWNGAVWSISSQGATELVAKGEIVIGSSSASTITRSPNGDDWVRMEPARITSGSTTLALAVDAAGHFWRAGVEAGASVIKRFTGSAWTGMFPTTYTALWGQDASNVFAVSLKNCYRYGGARGAVVTASGCSPQNLNAVWGTTAMNVYAVGDAGTVVVYNGSNWTPTSAGTLNLYGVWGSGAADIYAVGAAGTVMQSTGGAWSPATVPAVSDDLFAVWGTSNKRFIVGANGRVLRYDGTQWSSSQITTRSLRAVWGSSATDVWAAGDGGSLWHFNGTTWSPAASGTTLRLRALWGTASNDVFASGDNFTLVHFDGTAWSPVRVYANIGGSLSSMWGDGRRVFFGGLPEALDRIAFPAAGCATAETMCADATDDDCDFLVDCSDPDCRPAAACN